MEGDELLAGVQLHFDVQAYDDLPEGAQMQLDIQADATTQLQNITTGPHAARVAEIVQFNKGISLHRSSCRRMLMVHAALLRHYLELHHPSDGSEGLPPPDEDPTYSARYRTFARRPYQKEAADAHTDFTMPDEEFVHEADDTFGDSESESRSSTPSTDQSDASSIMDVEMGDHAAAGIAIRPENRRKQPRQFRTSRLAKLRLPKAPGSSVSGVRLTFAQHEAVIGRAMKPEDRAGLISSHFRCSTCRVTLTSENVNFTVHPQADGTEILACGRQCRKCKTEAVSPLDVSLTPKAEFLCCREISVAPLI